MERPAVSLALPRPGPALLGILIAMGVLGIGSALLMTWFSAGGGEAVFEALALKRGVAFHQPWRLFTSALLTNPTQLMHLGLSALGLYFLGAPLEQRWGSARFLRFFAIAVLFGNLITVAVDALPVPAQARFHPDLAFGPAAAIAGIAVAWALEYPDANVNLFLFVPVRAKFFLWMTLGLCVLDIVYPAGLEEGVVAPFGGVVAGLLFAGTPSRVRRAWLGLRLLFLRRRSGHLRGEDLLAQRPARRQRPGSPPLRVVPGGLEEVLKKRTPPKDKRYLN
jgi:membrane associated rhomboid family serine protease